MSLTEKKASVVLGRERSDSIRSTGERAKFRKQRNTTIFGFLGRMIGIESLEPIPAPTPTIHRQESRERKGTVSETRQRSYSVSK